MNAIKKAVLSAVLLLGSLGSAFATPGCDWLGGSPGAKYGLIGQILTDTLPCYGITGTKNSPVVLKGAPTITAPMTITGASAQALAVGRQGQTNPAFNVDSSNGASITGLNVIGQASGNGVNLSAIGETNVSLIINGAGNGTINLGTSSTGVISLFRNAFINHDTNPTLTLGSVGGTLAHLSSPGTAGTAFTTGGGDQVNVVNTASANRQVTLTGSNGGNPTISTTASSLALTSNTGHLVVEGVTSTGATGTGNFVFSIAPTITGHPTIEGVTSTGATGTGNLVFSASPTLTGTTAMAAATITAPLPKTSGGTGNTAESWQYIETLTASNSATLTTSAFTAAFDDYAFIYDNIVPVTDNVGFNATVESGGSFQATTYLNSAATTTSLDISTVSTVSNVAGKGFAGRNVIHNVNSATTNKIMEGRGAFLNSGGTTLTGAGMNGFWNGGQGAVTRVRWQMTSGNISTGTIKVFGIRNN